MSWALFKRWWDFIIGDGAGRGSMFFLMKSLLTVLTPPSLTPPSILHSFQLPHRTHSLTHLSWEEYLGWLLSLHLCELDFLHFVQAQFPHLKDRNNVNISYHLWMWFSNFTCIDMSNPHKTTMMLVLLLAPLFHRWANWHSEHQITCPRSQSKGVVS